MRSSGSMRRSIGRCSGEKLERIFRKERKSAADRKPMDRVVMCKMRILQNLYGLSGEALEYEVWLC